MKRNVVTRFVALFALVVGLPVSAWAQTPLELNFDTVTGSPGVVATAVQGTFSADNWEDALANESVFGETTGLATIGELEAIGSATAGVSGTGAAVLNVSDVTTDLLNQDFSGTTGVGSTFAVGDGATENITFFTDNWDDNISDESAFMGVFGDAVLDGEAQALGDPAGSGTGSLTVSDVSPNTGGWFGGLIFKTGPLPGVDAFLNPGFDSNGGSFEGWTPFGNAVIGNELTRSSPASLKMFGLFNGAFNASGAFQSLPAAEGEVWRIDSYSGHLASDSISGGANFAVQKIEFLDAGGAVISATETTILDNTSPTDVMIDNAPLEVQAPAGTERAQAVIVFLQPDGAAGGAAHVDDVSFKKIGLNQDFVNGDFEANGGSLDGWGPFGNALSDGTTPRSGVAVAKMFGLFTGSFSFSGITQKLPAVEGQEWELDGFVRHNTGDSLQAGNFVDMKIEFQDAGSNNIGEVVSPAVIDSTTTLDTWVDVAPLAGTAPAGTAFVQAVFVFVQPEFQGGAALIDDVTFAKISGPDTPPQPAPSPIDLSDFTLDANVQGIVGGAGEVLADIQLRIEDSDGARLRTNITADGTLQAIGGSLDTFQEADASGNPATGVFNAASGIFQIVVGFDGDWGTGGAISIDDIIFTNPNLGGGDWNAGLRFGSILGPVTGDMSLLADVSGSASDAPVDLKVEGFVNDSEGSPFPVGSITLSDLTDSGAFTTLGGPLSGGVSTFFSEVEEDFDSAAGDTTGVFTGAPDQCDFDSGVTNEAAFFGTFGDVVIGEGGGAEAAGCTDCGVNGSGALTLNINSVDTTPGGGSFAGLYVYGFQAPLGAQDLADVFISADIKAIIDEGAGQVLPEVVMRIEDETLDFIEFKAFATEDFQAIGGFLADGTPGTIGGGGASCAGPRPPDDGVFNLSPGASYTITMVVGNNIGLGGHGTGVTMILDNLSFGPGLGLSQAEFYEVSVDFGGIDEGGSGGGAALDAWGENASLTVDNLVLGSTGAGPFVRGDANGDGNVNIADPSFIANFVFGIPPATEPPCGEAADANGDSGINIADVSFVANFVFGVAPATPPPAPGTTCGTAPATTALGCETPPAACVPQ